MNMFEKLKPDTELTPEQQKVLKTIKVVDGDTHYTEPHDLWTSRVSGKMKDLVPNVVRQDNGRDMWLFNDGEVLNQHATTASSILPDGSKDNFWDVDITNGPQIEEVHPSSWEIQARCEMMDQMGVHAQIVYPNVLGFGNQRMMKLQDRSLALDICAIYNDAMAEKQEESKNRFFPQALMPFWDVELAVKEIERAHKMGLTGIAMCPEPHLIGLPDLADRYWDDLWAVCEQYDMPINFHIGASPTNEDLFKDVWPSQDRHRRWVIMCSLLESNQSRILANLVSSDLLVRFPKTKWVSVESGIGWIPFILERLEYQLYESDPPEAHKHEVNYDRPTPWELFHRQVYSCFWFEETAPQRQLDILGFDNVLFESDFPHPTCLYPNPVERAFRQLENWGEEAQRKVMGGNAKRIYNLPGMD
jgi:uncharacterized protein